MPGPYTDFIPNNENITVARSMLSIESAFRGLKPEELPHTTAPQPIAIRILPRHLLPAICWGAAVVGSLWC